MPRGAYHEDLKNIRKFKKYALIHARSWYLYAKGPRGEEIGNSELHLVTGCDKTASWGIAAYAHPIPPKRPEDNVSLLRFNPNEYNNGHSSYTTYEWDYEGTPEAKFGPEHEELMNLRVDGYVPPRNQCTFIRSLTPAFGDDDWKDIELKVESSMKDQASEGSPQGRFPSLLSGTGALSGTLSPASPHCKHSNSLHFQQGDKGFFCGRSRGGSSEMTDSMTPTQVSASDRIIPLFRFLLSRR